MQKHTTWLSELDPIDTGLEAKTVEVYLASEADARFEQLEKALKSCAAILIMDIREREKFLHIAKEAVLEANKALAS